MSKTRNLGNLTDLLTAGSTYVTTTTPPQFDNTTNLVTSEFIKKTGISYGGIDTVLTTATLTVAAAGRIQYLGGSSTYTVTLPSAATFPAGASIVFMCVATAAVTIARASTDNVQVNNATVTSLVMNAGDTLELVSNGVNLWIAKSGSVQLNYSGTFLSVASVPGYQKLTNGLILQWGTCVSNGSGIAQFSYPVSYTTFALPICSYLLSGSALGVVAQTSSSSTNSLAQFNAFSTTNGAAVSGANIYVMAIGK